MIDDAMELSEARAAFEKGVLTDDIAATAAKVEQLIRDYHGSVTFAQLQMSGLIQPGHEILHPAGYPNIMVWQMDERSIAVMRAVQQRGNVEQRGCHWLCYAHDGFLPANVPLLKPKGKSDKQLMALKKLYWAPMALWPKKAA